MRFTCFDCPDCLSQFADEVDSDKDGKPVVDGGRLVCVWCAGDSTKPAHIVIEQMQKRCFQKTDEGWEAIGKVPILCCHQCQAPFRKDEEFSISAGQRWLRCAACGKHAKSVNNTKEKRVSDSFRNIEYLPMYKKIDECLLDWMGKFQDSVIQHNEGIDQALRAGKLQKKKRGARGKKKKNPSKVEEAGATTSDCDSCDRIWEQNDMFVCKDCQRFICPLCCLRDHKTHEYGEFHATFGMLVPTVILAVCAQLISAFVTVLSGGQIDGPPIGGLCLGGNAFRALTIQGDLACYRYSSPPCDLVIKDKDPGRQGGRLQEGHCPTGFACIAGDVCYDVISPDICRDNDSNCVLYRDNGFCRSKLYTTAQKKDACCRTCLYYYDCQDADPDCPLYEKNNNYCNNSTDTEELHAMYKFFISGPVNTIKIMLLEGAIKLGSRSFSR
ncbi:unnamed protein product, partial [Mesorhabditis spiculigera]